MSHTYKFLQFLSWAGSVMLVIAAAMAWQNATHSVNMQVEQTLIGAATLFGIGLKIPYACEAPWRDPQTFTSKLYGVGVALLAAALFVATYEIVATWFGLPSVTALAFGNEEAANRISVALMYVILASGALTFIGAGIAFFKAMPDIVLSMLYTPPN